MGYAEGRLVNVHSKPAGIHVVLSSEVGVRCWPLGTCVAANDIFLVVLGGLRLRTWKKLGYAGGRTVNAVG